MQSVPSLDCRPPRIKLFITEHLQKIFDRPYSVSERYSRRFEDLEQSLILSYAVVFGIIHVK